MYHSLDYDTLVDSPLSSVRNVVFITPALVEAILGFLSSPDVQDLNNVLQHLSLAPLSKRPTCHFRSQALMAECCANNLHLIQPAETLAC